MFFNSTDRNAKGRQREQQSSLSRFACWCPKADRERVKRERVDDLLCSTAAVGGCEARGRKATLSLSLSLFFFYLPVPEPGGRGVCGVVVEQGAAERDA